MHSTPVNYTEYYTEYYTEWERHIPDCSFADDGFGNLILTDIDAFWFNVDRSTENLH